MFRNLVIGTALAGCLGPGALSARQSESKQATPKPTVLCSDFPLEAKDWTPLDSSANQLQRDVGFFMATLCRDPMDYYLDHKGGKPAWKDSDLTAAQAAAKDGQDRIRILARVFAAMAYGNLTYSHTENASEGRRGAWKWPLASALAHGQRVVFHCKGFDSYDLYKLFTTGKVGGDNSIDRFDLNEQDTGEQKDSYGRWGASHGFSWSDGSLKELKLGNMGSVWRGMKGLHHGINLPIGGVGNPWLDKTHLVGPVGYPLDAATLATDSAYEHGHLYMHHDNLYAKDGKRIVEGGLMVGIETNQYGKTNMYGAVHKIDSAKKDQTKDTGLFGEAKWALVAPDDGPAEYGGKWVELELSEKKGNGDPNPAPNFEELQRVIKEVDKLRLGTAKAQKFLKALLGQTLHEDTSEWPPRTLIMNYYNNGLAKW